MILEKITEIDRIPKIGEWFSVPTYPVSVFGKRKKPILWEWKCPVLLPCHEDGKILNFPIWHYHVDFRFFSDNSLKSYWKNFYEKSLIKNPEDLGSKISLIRTKGNKPDYENVVWKDMMYQRHSPEMKTFLPVLHEKFCKVKVKCLKCPHKKINLADRIPDENGVITCPGHGLKFKKENNHLTFFESGVL